MFFDLIRVVSECICSFCGSSSICTLIKCVCSACELYLGEKVN